VAAVGLGTSEYAGFVAIGGLVELGAASAINAYYGNYTPMINTGYQTVAAGYDKFANTLTGGLFDYSPFPSPFGKAADEAALTNPCPSGD
jgi:hypothetical protein